jgi:zinc-ribbon domain
MKCSKCNAEIPDSSKFCPQCAEPQNTPMIAPPPQVVDSGSRMGATKMFFIGLAVAGIAFLVWNVIPGFRYAPPHHLVSPVDVWAVPTNPPMPTLPCQDDLHPNANWRVRADGLCHAEDALGMGQRQVAAAPQPPPPQPHSVPLGAGALTVNASAYSWYQVSVPPGVTSVSISGHFTATGGMGNDITVYILDEDGFTNFKNGHPAQTFYNSEKVTTATIDAALPNRPTSYYLVFDNRFSLLTPKAVQLSATLNYMQ